MSKPSPLTKIIKKIIMEKPLKVFWNGKLLREIYPHATRFQVFKYKMRKFFRKVIIATVGAGVIYMSFFAGGALNPKVNYIQAEAIVKIPAVMQRISNCETKGDPNVKGTHIGKSGQVVMNANTNDTVDVGKYQINTVWFKKATELGLDITKEEDNEKMALWIYENRGTGDWSSSASCWKN